MKTKADELAEMIMTPEAWDAGIIGDEIIYGDDLAKLSKAIEAAIDERVNELVRHGCLRSINDRNSDALYRKHREAQERKDKRAADKTWSEVEADQRKERHDD